MMTIKELRQPAARQTKVTLVFDNDTVLKVLPMVVAELGLYTGQELDEADMERLRTAAGQASSKNRAVRIISAAGVTKRELENRLVQKGEKPEDAAQAVRWLSDLNLLDDAEIARQTVLHGVSRGYGKRRIQQMLYEKRVPKEYWEEALAQLPPMEGAIDSFLRSRFQGQRPDQKELKRATDTLLRRGHEWAEIKAVLRHYYSDSEDLSED